MVLVGMEPLVFQTTIILAVHIRRVFVTVNQVISIVNVQLLATGHALHLVKSHQQAWNTFMDFKINNQIG